MTTPIPPFMFDLDHSVFFSDEFQTTDSEDPVLGYTLARLDQLAPDEEYVMIVSGIVGANSGGATNNSRIFEIQDNGVVLPLTTQQVRPIGIVDEVGVIYSALVRFTKAPVGDVTLMLYNLSGVSTTLKGAQGVFINLTDLQEGVDYLWNFTDDIVTNIPATPTDSVEIVLPEGDEPWIAFAISLWNASSTNGFHRTIIGDDGNPIAEASYISRVGSEKPLVLTSFPVDGLVSGTKVVKCQIASEFDANSEGTALFVFRLGIFEAFLLSRGGSVLIDTADTYFEVESVTGVNIIRDGNFFLIGSSIRDVTSASNNRDQIISLNINGAGFEPEAGFDTRQIEEGTGGQAPGLVFGQRALAAGDTVDAKLEVRDTINSADETASEAWLLGATWAELSDDGSRPNTPPVVEDEINDQECVISEPFGPVDISGNFSDPEGEELNFEGFNLPNGLSVSSLGVISGTPIGGSSGTVPVPNLPEWLSTPTPPDGKVGDDFFYNFGIHLNSAPVLGSLEIVNGSIPDGLAFSGTALLGIPTESGSFVATVRVINQDGFDDIVFGFDFEPISQEYVMTAGQQLASVGFVRGIIGSITPDVNFFEEGLVSGIIASSPIVFAIEIAAADSNFPVPDTDEGAFKSMELTGDFGSGIETRVIVRADRTSYNFGNGEVSQWVFTIPTMNMINGNDYDAKFIR